MEKSGKNIIFWCLLGAIILLAGSAVFLVLTSFTETGGTSSGNPGPESLLITGEYRIDNGDWTTLTGNSIPSLKGVHTVTVKGHLSANVAREQELLFYIENLTVSVSVNGQPVYSFGEYGAYPRAFSAPGITWGKCDTVSGISTNDELEIVLRSHYRNTDTSFNQFLGTLSVGSYSELYEQMFREDGNIIFIALFVICLGLFAFFLAVAGKICHLYQASKSAVLSLFAIVCGFWILFDMGAVYYPLLIPSPTLACVYKLLALYLLAPNCMLIICEYADSSIQKYIQLFTILIGAMTGFFILAQALGLIQLYEVSNIILQSDLIMLSASIVLTGISAFRNKNRASSFLVISLLPGMFTAILSRIDYYREFLSVSFLFSAGIMITLLLLMLQVIYLLRQSAELQQKALRLEKELAENRITTMLSQIQPHFIYNVLNAISGLCSIDPEKADGAIITFSGYLRNNIDFLTSADPITFYEEKRHIRQYVELEQLRFGDKIHVEYDTRFSDFTLPPLTLQPVVENAIKHGISVKPDGGTVTILTERVENYAVVTISDDGVGFDPSAPKSSGENRQSVGLRNVRERLSYVSHASMETKSAPGHGTVVTIRIPIQSEENSLI